MGGGFISSLDVRARLFNAGLIQPRRSVKSDFRSESFKLYWIFYKQLRTLSLKAFKQRNKETQIKIQPWVSANLHLNNWPQVISFLLLGHVVLAHQVAALGHLMHLAHNTLPLISLWRLSA